MTKQNLGGSFAYHKFNDLWKHVVKKVFNKFTELKFVKLLRICQLKYQWKYEERKSQFY